MLELVIIIASVVIIVLTFVALYAISKWRYWQDKCKNITKVALLCLFVMLCSCNTTKFTTTHTQVNFYEYPDTINWKIKGDRIFMDGKRTECIIDSNVVRYKIDGAPVYVKHW